MTTITASYRRAALLGGLVLIACAPVVVAVAGPGSVPSPTRSLAYCPSSEEFDPISGACRPLTDQPAPTFSPLNPENTALQPGSLTSPRAGEVGQLPEVNGIPCNGSNTGLCIALQDQDNMLNARPENPNVASP